MTERREAWPLKALRTALGSIRTIIIISIMLFLLIFNIASFTVAPIAGAMVSLAQRLALTPVVATAGELAAVRERASRAENRIASLEESARADKRSISTLEDALDNAEADKARLTVEKNAAERRASALGTKLDETEDALRKAPRVYRESISKVDDLSNTIVRRTHVKAMRNLASMPLESVPIVGVMTIVTVTALEISDACQTAKDVEALRTLAGLPSSEAGLVENICSSIPSINLGKSEMTIQQCREHADEVRETLGPEAAELIHQQCDCYELPDGCPGEVEGFVEVKPPPPPD